MFGFLRRLLMAGDIKGVLDGSRRALRELSPALGERGVPTAADEFVVNATRGTRRPGNLTPEDIFAARALERGEPYVGESPFGGRVEIMPDGRRVRRAPNMYSGMASPYDRLVGPVNPAYGTTREREAIANNLRARRDARMREDMGDPYLESGGEDLDYWEFERPQMNIDLYNQMARRVGRGKPVPSWWEYPYWNGGPETYFGGSSPELYPYEGYVNRRPFRENFYTSNPTPMFDPIPELRYLDEGGLPF